MIERTRTLQPVPESSAYPSAAAAPASSSLAALANLSESPSKEEGPAVVFASPSVKGGLLTDVDAAVRRLRAGVRACYVRFLEAEEEPPEASSLSLHLFVMQNGSVKAARADEVSHLPAGAVDCIVRRAQVATFPPPAGEASEVTVSIHLHP